MRISSPAFEDGGIIPDDCTREGGNKPPTLCFEDVPASTQSLAVILENPDAPQGLLTHWVVFNLSPSIREVDENTKPLMLHQGRNDCGVDGYSGPKSPSPDHGYCFRLFALDTKLALAPGAPRLDVEEAIIGHVIEEARCCGHFGALQPAGA
jgi:hypothetical protein